MSKANSKVVIANWKMNKSFDEAEIWLKNLLRQITFNPKGSLPNLVVCPPAILLDYLDELLMSEELEEINKIQKNIDGISEPELEKLMSKLRKVHLGGQNCHQESSGSYTGDISAGMLQDAGCEYVILGHSERRQQHFESDQIVAQKIRTALDAKLIPILCVGESLSCRQENNYLKFVEQQLEAALPKNLNSADLIIAYEPIWSIGTGVIAKHDQIAEMTRLIKDFLQRRTAIGQYKIVYGGSVKKDNAKEIATIENIDGFLVGGSSLDANEFFAISQFLS